MGLVRVPGMFSAATKPPPHGGGMFGCLEFDVGEPCLSAICANLREYIKTSHMNYLLEVP